MSMYTYNIKGLVTAPYAFIHHQCSFRDAQFCSVVVYPLTLCSFSRSWSVLLLHSTTLFVRFTVNSTASQSKSNKYRFETLSAAIRVHHILAVLFNFFPEQWTDLFHQEQKMYSEFLPVCRGREHLLRKESSRCVIGRCREWQRR